MLIQQCTRGYLQLKFIQIRYRVDVKIIFVGIFSKIDERLATISPDVRLLTD